MNLFIDADAAPGGANWRHWRIYISANNGDSYTAIQEVELRATIGGADITSPSGMTVTQSSFYAPSSNNGSRAFDDDYTDFSFRAWIDNAAGFPCWVAIDLNTAASVAEVAMWCQAYGGGPARAPKDFKVQGSSDGSTWTDVQTFTNATGWTSGTPMTFTL